MSLRNWEIEKLMVEFEHFINTLHSVKTVLFNTKLNEIPCLIIGRIYKISITTGNKWF